MSHPHISLLICFNVRTLPLHQTATLIPYRTETQHPSAEKEKKNHYLFSSQLRADQMPGPPWEGQLISTDQIDVTNL